jgi:hypothetical protein
MFLVRNQNKKKTILPGDEGLLDLLIILLRKILQDLREEKMLLLDAHGDVAV